MKKSKETKKQQQYTDEEITENVLQMAESWNKENTCPRNDEDEKIERFDKSVTHYVFTIGVSAVTAMIITLFMHR